MNRTLVATFLLLSLGTAGIAGAQSAPPATDPAQATTAPSQQAPARPHSADTRGQKECVAQLRKANSGMTERDIGEYCKAQVSGSETQGDTGPK